MIQPTALLAVPGLLPPGEALPAPAMAGLEGTDFGALLAIEAGGIAPPGAQAKLPVFPGPGSRIVLPDAAVLPEGGKDLPLALPVIAAEETPAPEQQPMPTPTIAAIRRAIPLQAAADTAKPIEERPSAPAEAEPRGATQAPQGTVTTRSLRTARPVPVAEPAPNAEAADGEVPAQPEPPLLAAFSEAPVAVAALVFAGQVTGPPAEAPHHLQPNQSGLQAPEPAAVATPPLASGAPGPALPRPAPSTPIATQPASAAPLAGTELTAPQPVPAPAPITLSVITVPVVAAPSVTEPRLRQTLPAADAGQALEAPEPLAAEPRLPPAPPAASAAERPRAPSKVAPVASVDLALPVAGPTAPSAVLSAPSIPVLPALAPFAPAELAARPHDFVALVDRLVAARELVQPQAFQVAVQHSEFGQIQLRFRQGGDGLSITMASADPEFARVVSAAPPPVLLPLTASDPAAGQGAQRSDSQSQSTTGSGHSAQHRGGSPERREDRNGPADNPAPPRHGAGRDPRRSGIFA